HSLPTRRSSDLPAAKPCPIISKDIPSETSIWKGRITPLIFNPVFSSSPGLGFVGSGGFGATVDLVQLQEFNVKPILPAIVVPRKTLREYLGLFFIMI